MNGTLSHTEPTRARIGGWWRFRKRVFDRWITRGLAGCRGWVLKTDLFDEACGPNHHLANLPTGTIPIGIDVDQAVCRLAAERLRQEGAPAHVVVADVRCLPFGDGSFAGVVSLSTLDHFDGFEEVSDSFVEIARVLRAGGKLLLALDNPANPEVVLRRWLPKIWVRSLRSDQFSLGVTMGAGRGSRELALAGLHAVDVGFFIHPLRYPAIRFMDWAERNGWVWLARLFMRFLEQGERMQSWPTRALTGHYVGWICENQTKQE